MVGSIKNHQNILYYTTFIIIQADRYIHLHLGMLPDTAVGSGGIGVCGAANVQTTMSLKA